MLFTYSFTTFICINIELFDSVVGKEIATFVLVFFLNSVSIFHTETCSIKFRIAQSELNKYVNISQND